MDNDSKFLSKEQHTIATERAKASFPIRELTYYIDGGKDATEYKERVFTMIERDPEIMVEHFFDMSRPEAREKCTRQIRRVAELRNQFANDPKFKSVLNTVINQYDRSLAMRLYVHDTLFYESIYAQGTSEQFQHWKDKMLKTQCLGCFAMTEMGHSSFLRGLETTATYDSKHDEFVINSPTLTSTKWWIGMAGQIATHTVALCQLIIDGSSKGLHWFIVPLRDPETGRLLPGVAAGDVGAKMGRAGLDNGWMQFNSVRIPRTNMLMKWGQVTKEGKYTPPPNQTVVYASLIGERLLVPAAVFDNVGQAITIAIRYGAVRRQGNNDEQLLYYQSHQHNLMPVVAGVYASLFVYRYIDAYWKESIQLSEKGPSEQKEFLRRTSDVHTTTAGLKTFTGWWAVDAMEMCRRALGGHGYSAYNAIAGLIGDWGVINNGGGDNVVLAQQCARYLLGSLQKVVSGKKVSGSVAYLNDYKAVIGNNKYSGNSLRKTEVQLEIFQWLSLKLIETAAGLLQSGISDGNTMESSWNNNMMQILEAARAHTWYYVLVQFVRGVTSAPSNLQPVLKTLCDLFALSTLNSMKHHLLELQYFTPQHTKVLYEEMLRLCREVREQCVPLVDALNIPDWILKAPMGRADGDVYRSYFETVLKAPNARGVVPYWDSTVKPMLAKL